MSGARDRAGITDSRASTAQVSPVGPRCSAPGGWHSEASAPASHGGLTGLTPFVRLGDRGVGHLAALRWSPGKGAWTRGLQEHGRVDPLGFRPRGPAKSQVTCSLSGQDPSKHGLGTRRTEDK